MVEDLELPDLPYDAMAGVIIEAEAASAFEPLFESGRITTLTAVVPATDRSPSRAATGIVAPG